MTPFLVPSITQRRQVNDGEVASLDFIISGTLKASQSEDVDGTRLRLVGPFQSSVSAATRLLKIWVSSSFWRETGSSRLRPNRSVFNQGSSSLLRQTTISSWGPSVLSFLCCSPNYASLPLQSALVKWWFCPIIICWFLPIFKKKRNNCPNTNQVEVQMTSGVFCFRSCCQVALNEQVQRGPPWRSRLDLNQRNGAE